MTCPSKVVAGNLNVGSRTPRPEHLPKYSELSIKMMYKQAQGSRLTFKESILGIEKGPASGTAKSEPYNQGPGPASLSFDLAE